MGHEVDDPVGGFSARAEGGVGGGMDACFFRTRATEIANRLRDWRRDIHAHPELGLECFRTGEIVARELEGLGLVVRKGLARSGVVATLRGLTPRPTVGLRFDMDALPLQEETGLPFASGVPGRAHACGHDGHTAVGLGVAHILVSLREQLPGGVKFIFEPGEEYPGGARYLIEEGVLEDPPVDAILGLHLFPGLPAHTIGVRYGPMTAQNDEFTVEVKGRGGHGAYPHQCADPVVAAAALVMGLQTIVSRHISPLESAVVTVAEICGGSGHNVIPEGVTLRGTVRTLDRRVRERVLGRLEAVTRGVEAAHDVTCRVEVVEGEPALICHPELTSRAEAALRELWGNAGGHAGDVGHAGSMGHAGDVGPGGGVGEAGGAVDKGQGQSGRGCVVRLLEPSLGADDFAYFSARVPATYLRFGVRDAAHTQGLHTPGFDFDEEVMITAVTSLSYLVWRLLPQLPLLDEGS